MDRRSGIRRTIVALAVSATAGLAAAHETGASRFDAPIPLELLYLGAGATVVATAAWLGYAGERPDSRRRTIATASPGTVRLVGTAGRVGFLLATLAAVAHGVAGTTAAAENLATVFVWPVWFHGLALVAIIAGTPWRWLSPWETIHAGLERLEGGRVAVLGDYPDWLSHWPALVGFLLLIGIAENLTVLPREPALTAAAVGVYGLAMVLGSLAFGRTWFRRADPLDVFYRLLGRVAPLSVERGGDGEARTQGNGDEGAYRVVLRHPWTAATAPVRDRSLVAFAVAAVYTVSFDGFTATGTYQDVLFAARDLAGIGPVAGVGVYFAGLAGFLGAYAAATALSDRIGTGGAGEGSTGTRDAGGDRIDDGEDDGIGTADVRDDRIGAASHAEDAVPDGSELSGDHRDARSGDPPVRDAAVAYAATLVPIAGAYEVAHGYPYVAANAGATVTVALDLVAGVAPGLDPLWWLPLPAFWASQVALIVAGHVVAVVAAHAVATRRYPTVEAARRGHLPLVAVMVAYTVVSLWIVSRPVATG